MKKTSRIIDWGKRIFNVRKWLDWARVSAANAYFIHATKCLFIPKKAIHHETFNETMSQLNLSEEHLIEKQKSLFFLSMLMLSCAVLIFIYAAYQLIFGSIQSFIVSLVIASIALVLAFRYHFWYFQMKKRKLGCSFYEWYKEGFLGEHK